MLLFFEYVENAKTIRIFGIWRIEYLETVETQEKTLVNCFRKIQMILRRNTYLKGPKTRKSAFEFSPTNCK